MNIKSNLVLIIFTVISLFNCRLFAAEKSQHAPFVGTVNNSGNKYLNGCGFFFSREAASDDLVFLFEESNGGVETKRKGWVNIDGKIIELYFLKDWAVATGDEPHKIEMFSAGKIEVKVDSVEVARKTFKAEVIVSNDKQIQKISTVGWKECQ